MWAVILFGGFVVAASLTAESTISVFGLVFFPPTLKLVLVLGLSWLNILYPEGQKSTLLKVTVRLSADSKREYIRTD